MTRRQEAKAATRAKVLEAARTAFETLGYERATIRDMANSYGMSTWAIFASFSGKAELYTELYGHPPISPEVGRQLLAALKALRAAVAASPAMQGREHVGLGIQVNNALARAA